MRLGSGNASLRCEYCNTVVTLAQDIDGIEFLEEAPDLECPVCAAWLWNAVLGRVQLHACKQCHGLLAPMSGLEPLVENLRAAHPGGEVPVPADPADLDRKVICPRCHQRMDSDFYAGGGNAVVASCERCELDWLGGGALMRIVHAPQTSDAEPAF